MCKQVELKITVNALFPDTQATLNNKMLRNVENNMKFRLQAVLHYIHMES